MYLLNDLTFFSSMSFRSYDDAVKEPVVTATKITGPKITSPTRPEDERLNTTNTTHNIFSSSDLNNNNKDST